MNNCTSCKNRTSEDRCTSKCIKGLDVCGIHAKSKTRRNWYVVNNLDKRVSKIQALWRGFFIRNLLKRAGPGVLNRRVCHNEEELITLEPVSRIHPLSYFAFEEAGKVWAFDITTLCKILIQNEVPLNPYTRTPLPHETRRRMRLYFYHNWPKSFKLMHTEVIPACLVLITQTLHENGFEDFRSEYLHTLSRQQTGVMKALMLNDMRALPTTIRRKGYCSLLNSRTFMLDHHYTVSLISLLSIILRRVRSCPSEEYEICFLIMSALFRV